LHEWIGSTPRPSLMHIPRIFAVAAVLFVVAPSLSSAGPLAPAPTSGAPGKTPVGKTGIPDDSIKPVAKTGTNDDSIKPIKPGAKTGIPDDSIKPVAKTGVADDGLKPVKPADPKVLRARALKVLGRTHALLIRAHKAVIKGDKSKDDYRKARVAYAAALTAFNANKPALSAKLALDARTYARKVLETYKQAITPQDATIEPDELAAAEGVSATELASASKAADKTTPPVEELAKTEPAAPPVDPPPTKPAPAPSTK